MQDVKSYAEFVLGLYAALLKDCAVQYPALTKEFNRDLSRLSSAVEHHGIRFVLDDMPSWRKHFDKCLADGRLTLSHQRHFGSWKKGGTVPKLFRGLVLRVFDLTGELKPEPDITAVRFIRQLLGVARRFRIACGDLETREAIEDFYQTDASVWLGTLDWESNDDIDIADAEGVSFTDAPPDANTSIPCEGDASVSRLDYMHARCIQLAADYISAHMGSFDPTATKFRHGPGAVSDQRFGSYKYDFKTWPDRLDSVFPKADFAAANYALWLDTDLYKDHDLDSNIEIAAKLCCVPKTIKAPRLIAAEPTSLQWCQQSIRDHLYNRVRGSIIGSFIDFRRQELNGNLARDASLSGSHCTIDLSSASDRVSCWHVERLFRRSPSLLNALRATRSRTLKQDIVAGLPSEVFVRKYSTMGNATTFPVQSLFFLSLILGTICFKRSLKVCDKTMRLLAKEKVRVFGDDLIVPADCAGAIVDTLHALNLKVNPNKTFLTGLFRESCGVDAFMGHDVTSVSVLDVPNRAKPGSIVSAVDTHNNLCNRGYMHAAAYIQKTVSRLGIKQIPHVAHGSGSFGWQPNYLVQPTPLRRKWDDALQIWRVHCLALKAKASACQPEGSAAFLQFFTEATAKVTSSFSTLHYQVRRAQLSLKLGWVVLDGGPAII